MADMLPERLSSSHLEDLAFIVLSARPDTSEIALHPELSTEARALLRSRMKQLGRYNLPASLTEDPTLRRGYTLRQCCRLSVALMLVDAHLPASLAATLTRDNEVSFLRAMAARLSAETQRTAGPDDQMAVMISGELQDALASPAWRPIQSARVRLLRRDEVSLLWSDDLAGSGGRLVIDVATAANALWTWISSRRLMTDTARQALIIDIAREKGPGFVPKAGSG